MCHMLFTLFIFRPSSTFSFFFLPFSSFSLAFLPTIPLFRSLLLFFWHCVLSSFLSLLPPFLSPSARFVHPVSSRSLHHYRYSFSLASRYFSILLLFSRSLNCSPSLFYSLPRWFSFPLCSRRSHLPCLPFRLLVYTLS